MSFNQRRGGGYGNSNPTPLRRPQTNQANFNQRQRLQTPRGRGQAGNVSPWGHQNRQQGQSQPMRQQAQAFFKSQEGQVKQEQPPQQQPAVEKVQAPPPPQIKPNETTNEEKPELNNGNDESQEVAKDGDKTTPKVKPHWVKGPGKVNKKELRRRRNLRLRKILQPKNALMVLNEIVGSTPYEVTELSDPFNGSVFQCAVQVEGMQHIGHGKSKPSAKNAAAETALKHMVLGKMKNMPPINNASASQEGEDEIKMDMDDNAEGISWSHVACYALHKLLNSWDEGSGINFAEKVGLSADTSDSSKSIEKKPAKKLPDLASTMNPVMLLNQMFPSAVFEEVSKEGNPPNIQFTIKCMVGNDTFLGIGATKKIARRMCAFAACRQILGIEYKQAFLEEQGFSEDAIKIVASSQ